jgi:hypothetical protein
MASIPPMVSIATGITIVAGLARSSIIEATAIAISGGNPVMGTVTITMDMAIGMMTGETIGSVATIEFAEGRLGSNGAADQSERINTRQTAVIQATQDTHKV